MTAKKIPIKYLCNCETIFENNLTQGEISLTIGEESHLGMACQTCQTSSQTGSQTSSQTCLSCLYNTEQEKLNIYYYIALSLSTWLENTCQK